MPPIDTPTDSFLNLAQAMLVAIALVYLLIVILFALPLVAVIAAFVSLAATGRALNLSALADLQMPRGIVVTNAVVLLMVCIPTLPG